MPPQIQRGEAAEQTSMDSDCCGAARKFWTPFHVLTRFPFIFRSLRRMHTALHWLFCTRKLTFDQKLEVGEVEMACYFFAVKWGFDKMGIWSKMLAVWVKMGSHFIENGLYPGSMVKNMNIIIPLV